jgi:tetratricopeptide (TPR) repeat protein
MANSSGPSGWLARGTRFVGKPRRWAAIAFGSPSGGSPPRKPNDSGDPCEKSGLALSLCFAALMLVTATTPARADSAWATQTYQQAEKLYEAGQYVQALALYEQIIAREPEAKLSFCRAGTAAAGAGQLQKAINYYKSCEQVYPDSLLPRAELVKLYQIAGDIPDRDRERNDLLELHLNTTRQETKSVDHYIRDIFPVGQRSVVAWEYFDLTGDWPTRYRFIVVDDSDNVLFAVALSSSPQAQANAPAILGRPAKARIFHLDMEQDNVVTTLKVFEGEPSYDTIKPLAITAILHGESGNTAP